MSLTDQQWCPTSVQVTVLQARSLRIKGKSGTNDAYAVIQVGKEKYQTSVVEKCVAPVWKEEASFDLPQLNQGGGGGGTLHVHVLHRALVGPDKLLGQAVINLSQLSEDKTRNKTEWFKLLDKTGKPDKDRGEVLLDIQFMRNNMTASMFDLSAAGKSRSRLGKFKDKVRGKKKESDSVTSVAPSFSQVLTDSEEEGNGDSEAVAGKDGKHKKHKIKSLFSPKSNLQKSMSQSMSVLPGKNSTLTGSQSSGLNVDSSEGKKKFKFMIHKRSGSSGGKDSSSGREKQVSVEQSNLCINGSHIYCEEPPPRTSRISSNFSLASSGHGSMEDVPENSPPPEQQKAARKCSPWEEDEEEEEEEEEEDDTPEVENVKANIPESPDSSTAEEPTVQQRCHSAVSSVRSETGSVDEKDLISTQREKRPAPQPPVRSQAGKQPHREQDVPARHLAQINKQSKDKDVKTVSVSPQRSVQMIAPLCRSPTDSKNSQSLMQSNNANGTTNAAKHSKRPAPSVPPPVGEKQSSEPKTSSNLGGAETKQVKVVCGLNPFEDDEDESELTAQDDRDTAVSSNTGSICWPPAVSQTADKDAASQPKIKSSKTAHAPLPPAKNDISSNTLTDPDNGALQACDPYYESTSPGHVPVSPLQESQSLKVQNIVEAGVKKDRAPTPSRRLQPVRPLNPLEQQGASVVQGENENKSTGIPSGLQDKTTVDDSGMKGPYSQLTRQELISLILKQENQLSERDDKISELEQYIDNLLVRVIEEMPSILMSLTAMKKAA
uniref:Trichohyalin n=1 Tax=Oreochromis niloticus TaxID=8128 RepID=I3K8G3_ORENI